MRYALIVVLSLSSLYACKPRKFNDAEVKEGDPTIVQNAYLPPRPSVVCNSTTPVPLLKPELNQSTGVTSITVLAQLPVDTEILDLTIDVMSSEELKKLNPDKKPPLALQYPKVLNYFHYVKVSLKGVDTEGYILGKNKCAKVQVEVEEEPVVEAVETASLEKSKPSDSFEVLQTGEEIKPDELIKPSDSKEVRERKRKVLDSKLEVLRRKFPRRSDKMLESLKPGFRPIDARFLPEKGTTLFLMNCVDKNHNDSLAWKNYKNGLVRSQFSEKRRNLKRVAGKYTIYVNPESNVLNIKDPSGKFVPEFKDVPVMTGRRVAETIKGELKPPKPTQEGNYVISEQLENTKWVPPPSAKVGGKDDPRTVPGGCKNPLGDRWMGIGNNYGLHGTTYEHQEEFYNTTAAFRNQSLGCIRLSDKDIYDLYLFARVGDRVIVTTKAL